MQPQQRTGGFTLNAVLGLLVPVFGTGHEMKAEIHLFRPLIRVNFNIIFQLLYIGF